ncbi:dynein axonemal heavy chain 11 isoform X2 [Anomalospiza imberbis]|uniref:dynein axonemal heavy chain 11 isoform X2 n=1 Tax=Anomalospiza imberbis TaxID=187417 RepID=UPI00358EACF0
MKIRPTSSIDDWTKTQWREINVEQMDVQLRRFAKAGYTAIYFCNLSVSVPPLPHSSHPLGCFGKAFSSRRPSQTFWDSSFIKVEDEVQSIVVNAVQELSTEKQLVTDITDKENVMEATRKPKVYESFEALQQRTCSMAVPDIELVSVIMLAAEGFIDACLLARKFIIF